MDQITAGDCVIIRSADNRSLTWRAVSAPEYGRDFMVVWVCPEEEWESARGEGREPNAVPWPADEVNPLPRVSSIGESG